MVRPEHVVVPKSAFTPAPRQPLWSRALTSVGQALFFAIVVLALASVLSRATGQATLAERVDHNARAIVCILSIPPQERTIQDTKFCLRETGINVNEIPVPPRLTED